TIHISPQLQPVTRQASLTLFSANNLLEALLKLTSHCPDIKSSLLDANDQLNPYIRLSVNNTLVSDLATPVPDNSDIVIFAAIAGG
ncbi:hypothetical protein MNBD_GAMMA11-829, partial [hydrothermal vent metagenome]